MIKPAKLERILKAIEAERGPFILAGLFTREDSPGQSDLVVAAPWLERGKLLALREFVKQLSDGMGQEEVLSLSRIVTLNRRDPALKRILRDIGPIVEPIERVGHELFGLPLQHAYVFRARPSRPRSLPLKPTSRARREAKSPKRSRAARG